MKRWLFLALALPAIAWGVGKEVRFPGPGVELVGRLYLPEGSERFPAVVLLHGCSGLWARNGAPTRSPDPKARAEALERAIRFLETGR